MSKPNRHRPESTRYGDQGVSHGNESFRLWRIDLRDLFHQPNHTLPLSRQLQFIVLDELMSSLTKSSPICGASCLRRYSA
jgi:hypothetical protein